MSSTRSGAVAAGRIDPPTLGSRSSARAQDSAGRRRADGRAEREARLGRRPGQRLGAARSLRVGQQDAAFAVDHRRQRLGRQPPRHPRQRLLGTGERRQAGGHVPGRGARRRGEVGGVGGRVAEQQRDQLATAAPAQVLDLGLGLGEALDRVGGELVDVGEDRLGEQGERFGPDPGPPTGVGEAAPGHPGADPVGGLQRIEGAARPLLAAAERQVDLAARVAARVGIADQRHELGQRLLHPAPDPAPEAALQRPRVLRHLVGDRLEDLGRDRLDLAFDQVGDPAGRSRQGSSSRVRRLFWHLAYKFAATELGSDANTYRPGRRNLTSMGEMTRFEKAANLGGVVVPFVATIVAIVLLPSSLVSPGILAIAAFMYLITAVGITVGYHRLLTHRSFQTPKWLEYTFAVLGTMAVQGPVLSWVADHRKHHAHTDKEGDPHSPHVGHGEGLRGFWHAHTGWLMETQGRADWKKYSRDLYEDDGMRFISRHFVALIVISLLIPAALGYAITGTGSVRSPATYGVDWCGCSSSTTSPGASTRCVTSSAPTVRHRRSVHQRFLAVAPLARRVVAPQPPRLPPLRRTRPAEMGARSLGHDHLRAGEGGTRPQRGPHLTQAASRTHPC